jgi:hypothetical protein
MYNNSRNSTFIFTKIYVKVSLHRVQAIDGLKVNLTHNIMFAPKNSNRLFFTGDDYL